MSNKEAKILALVQNLTPAQQIEALNYALAMLEAKQEKRPVPAKTSD